MPKHTYNSNVNIIEFKIVHDDSLLYVYYRVVDNGVIGKTSVGPDKINRSDPSQPSLAGRFYIITTVNLDMNDTTGFSLHEDGY
ncbi:unnamed protein product [Rotaria sp. Silwood1]|nr:unnamed protein product [Rotaria sp. Silwood1]CAF4986804.1 unnamed protein product [Rotaria sp. Silwood1]